MTRYSRATLRFDIRFMQRVGAEDVFLGIGEKTPGSADCDKLVIKIKVGPATRSRECASTNVRTALAMLLCQTHACVWDSF